MNLDFIKNKQQKMKNLINIETLKVGDKLWSIQLGDCEVLELGEPYYPISCTNKQRVIKYRSNGKDQEIDKWSSLFTSNPFIEGNGKQVIENQPQEGEFTDKDFNTTTMNYESLFKHMLKEHDVALINSEMQEIINIVNQMQSEDKPKKQYWQNVYRASNGLVYTHHSVIYVSKKQALEDRLNYPQTKFLGEPIMIWEE